MKKLSKEWKKQISKSLKEYYKNYTTEESRKLSDEHKKKISRALSGKPKSKEHNKKVSNALKKRFRENTEARLRYVGNKNPAKQPGVGKKISKAKKGFRHSEKTKKLLRKRIKEHYKNGMPIEQRIKISNSLKNSKKFLNVMSSNSKRQKQSESMKKKWKEDKEYRKKAIITSCNNLYRLNRPTSLEIQLDNILRKKFHNEWIYVGLGQYIIDRMNPDFIHVTKNVVIEVNGNYWHTKEQSENKVKRFEKAGFKCIVFWQNEIESQNIESIVNERLYNV